MLRVHSKQYRFDFVAGLCGLCLGFEAVAEDPRLVVKTRVVPWKEFNHAVPQNKIVVLPCAWQPAFGLWGGLVSASRHGSPTPRGLHSRTGSISNTDAPARSLFSRSCNNISDRSKGIFFLSQKTLLSGKWRIGERHQARLQVE